MATTEAPAAAAVGRYPGSANPLMSLPTHAPARRHSSSTEARNVSTEIGTSKRERSASTAGTTRSISSAGVTSGPGPALTPPTSRKSAPSATSLSALARKSSKSQYEPWSKNESGVRLRIPITRARVEMSNPVGPNSSRIAAHPTG